MSSFFGMGGPPKKSPKEEARQAKRDIKHSERDIDREVRNLEREEEKLKSDIKKAAQQGNQTVLKTLAGNLVQLRKQRDRLVGVKGSLTSAGYRAQMMASQVAVAGTIGATAKVMGQINSQVDIKDTTKAMNEFARQTEYMNMREDLMDEALMDAFDGEEEEEADSIVNQVLEEIGLNVGSKLADAPSALPAAATAEAESEKATEDFERRLKMLQMP